MSVAEFDTFVCVLCHSDHSVFEVVILENCSCLFCRSCLNEYTKNTLQSCAEALTEAAFAFQYRPELQGFYIDDEGLPNKIQTIQCQWNGTWEDSEIMVKELNNARQDCFQTGYWRVFLEPSPCSTPSPSLPPWKQKLDYFNCPCSTCQGFITKSEIHELCREEFDFYLESEAIVESFYNGCIRCPTCGCMIERLQDLYSLAEQVEQGLTPEQHGEKYRLQCTSCNKDFCGVCLMTPYHTNLNCRQNKLPNCRFCQEKAEPRTMHPERMTTRKLKSIAEDSNVFHSWCLEKSDYIWVVKRISDVCERPNCGAKLKRSCTKRLPCGHGCCGVAENGAFPQYPHSCLPCFDIDCPKSSSDSDGCYICLESFSNDLTIRLNCGHLIHLDCAMERLEKGGVGPNLSFNHIYCSLCGNGGANRDQRLQDDIPMNSLWHPLLDEKIRPILELEKTVSKLALERLTANGGLEDPALKPGGAFEGRPEDFALSKYLFFMCHTCKKPYCGGKRDCQAAAEENGEDFNPEELICGPCSIAAGGHVCRIHGDAYIEWKCRFCCNIACWICGGGTHMCDPCHSAPNRGQQGKFCAGQDCPLKIPHPPPGTEFCLGCSLCHYHYD